MTKCCWACPVHKYHLWLPKLFILDCVIPPATDIQLDKINSEYWNKQNNGQGQQLETQRSLFVLLDIIRSHQVKQLVRKKDNLFPDPVKHYCQTVHCSAKQTAITEYSLLVCESRR